MSPSMPLIGVTIGQQLLPADYGSSQSAMYGGSITYCREVVRSGGAPILVPPIADDAIVARTLAALDGLLLSGGLDVNPKLYGQEPIPRMGSIDAKRDATEITAIRVAVERSLPILAICRGIQSLNVALGGTLIQHLDDSRKGAVCHSQRGVTPCVTHTVEIAPGSLLGRLFGEGRQWVNSHHHQAVDNIAPGFVVTARSADGVIEAIEPSDDRPILGLQFHPEMLADSDSAFRVFFDWFVQQAAKRKL